MALIICPDCNHEVSDQAISCPSCAHPIQRTATPYAGPPENCSQCGGGLKKGADASSEGSGCLIFFIGLLLSEIGIGIVLIIYGLHLMCKRDGFWKCRHCGAKYARKIKWYELA